MTKEDASNNLADNPEHMTADTQPQPMCIWASISMWSLLLAVAFFAMGISLDIYRELRWADLASGFIGACFPILLLCSFVSGIIALVVVKQSRGKIRGVERAGTCLVLSLMLLTPTVGLALLNRVKSRNAEILAPFQDGDIVKVRELLAEKPKIANKRLIWGDTPMHAAASNGHRDIVELLIENGANVDILSRYSRETPLHRAAVAGHLEVVTLLLDKGADIEAKDSTGETPLHEAAGAYENSEAVVRLLLERGADPTARNNYGQTPLDVAEERKHEEAAKVLREYSKDK